MPLLEVMMTTLAAPIGTFLLKHYLGEPAGAVGGGLAKIAETKLKNYNERRKAERQFEEVGEKVVQKLLPLFSDAEIRGQVNAETVSLQLAATFDGNISADYFLKRDLDPARLARAFRTARPLPKGHLSEAEASLYERALDEAVRYLVDVAASLPRFEANLAKESLTRMSGMMADLDEVLERTRAIERSVDLISRRNDEETSLAARYEADYRLAVLRNLDYVELFGVDIPPESRRQSLSVAYVSLNVQQSRAAGDPLSMPVDEVLLKLGTETKRLLVRGEAGSGKSTLFRWIAMQAAQLRIHHGSTWRAVMDLVYESVAGMDELFVDKRIWHQKTYQLLKGVEVSTLLWTANIVSAGIGTVDSTAFQPVLESVAWWMRVPFLVRLRDCSGGRLPDPDSLPIEVAKEEGSPPAAWVKGILRDGRGLVLLDGIDEVAPRHREILKREVEALARAYPNSYFLVSTRPTAVPDGWLKELDFQEARIDPMSETDRERFIEQWHEAVGREIERRGERAADLPETAARLIENLREHPAIGRLATNPLLCAMICALHRDRHQKLPETQSELCEAICHMLLHRRERESGLDPEKYPESYRALGYEEKRALVQDVAHYMVRNEEATISFEHAREIVEGSLLGLGRQAPASELLKTLVERSGILRESRPGVLDFIHNTLKEFLAAERFVGDRDFGVLANHAFEPAWQPVVLFAMSTRERGFATTLMQKILTPLAQEPEAGTSEDALHQCRLFALRASSAALHLAPELRETIALIERQLFPPRTMADAESLAAGGDSVVAYLKYRKRLPARHAAACIRALRLIGTQKAKAHLEGYLYDPRQTVVTELAQALNPLRVEKIREWLKEGKDLPKGVRSQITDLSSLSDLPFLQSLNLRGAQVTDLNPLIGLSSLQRVDLGGTQVTDVSALADLSNLQELNLSSTQVTNVSALASLSNLQRLVLWGTRVTDVSPLANLSNLQELDLSVTGVTEVSSLAASSNLQQLDLSLTDVTDVNALASLSNLQRLVLWGTRVTDVSPLANLSNLQELDLSETRVTDVSGLASLSNLQRLDLSRTQVTDMSVLASLPNLQQLYLSGTHITDVSMLASLSNLQGLFLSDTLVKDVSVLKRLSNLKMLDLRNTKVTDVSPLSNLATLHIVGLG